MGNEIMLYKSEEIERKIVSIRGTQVMLDRDLAELYGVETKRLNEQVKRNIERFPEDFMFQLDKGELEILKSQFATSSWGGNRKPPYANCSFPSPTHPACPESACAPVLQFSGCSYS